MKKLLLTAALAAAVIAPTAASAAEPTPATSKNAAKYCKELRSFAGGANFVSMFGTKKNAYGKCVSQIAKETATEDAAQTKAAKSNAAKECKADGLKGREYGKCVSTKAKAKKAAADKEDEAQEDDRINAAKSCKAEKGTEEFAAAYGTGKNAFGKCVSAIAKKNAADRKAEDEAPATTA
jgi:hypothetical protein